MACVPRFPPAHLTTPEEKESPEQHNQKPDSVPTESKASKSEQEQQHQAPLALPAPASEEEEAKKLEAGTEQTIKFDHLGPLVINSDGTLSRIHNWAIM